MLSNPEAGRLVGLFDRFKIDSGPGNTAVEMDRNLSCLQWVIVIQYKVPHVKDKTPV